MTDKEEVLITLSSVEGQMAESGQKEPHSLQTKQKHSINNSGAVRQWNKLLNLQHRSRAEILNLLFTDSCQSENCHFGQ